MINQFGSDGRTIVANEVFCVEFFPYHSRRFKRLRPQLASQEYSFRLVRQAVERGAIILVMRAERRWLEAVPELAAYPRRFTAKLVRNPLISPGNFGDGFQVAINAIRS